MKVMSIQYYGYFIPYKMYEVALTVLKMKRNFDKSLGPSSICQGGREALIIC